LKYLQTTIIQPFCLSGIGVHSGQFITTRVEPSGVNTGICFWREDISVQDNKIQATIDNTVNAQLCTRIENQAGIGINTIEHFMSALFAMGIDNANIFVDGPEMPILDGSADPIIKALLNAGQKQYSHGVKYLHILKSVSIDGEDGSWAQIEPASDLQISLHIDFPDDGIGQQQVDYSFTPTSYIEQIAPARTFCMMRDVVNMQRAGLAQGGSLENAIVVDNGKILNDGGLRMENECVNHKVLDCLGDLFLSGMLVSGKIKAFKPGHALTVSLMKMLLADKSSYEIRTYTEDTPRAGGYVQFPKVAAAVSA